MVQTRTTQPPTTKLEYGLLLMAMGIIGFMGVVLAALKNAELAHSLVGGRMFAASGITFYLGIFVALAGQKQNPRHS